MKKSIKAALFSGLVFPGAGHFSLKRYQRGMIFFVPTLLSLLFLVHYSLSKAYAIADQITLGKIPLDTELITSLISAPPVGTELLKLQIATWIMIVCWIVSIVDSYRLGKQADQSGA
jgi:hypothetical protein